jgi:acylphosphatase
MLKKVKDTMADIRWTLRISGKVQGVYYRASTEKEARRLGLRGYARNLPDGCVEVVAEGPVDDLKLLYDWCLEGPKEAEVTAIQVDESPATGTFSGFSIRYD